MIPECTTGHGKSQYPTLPSRNVIPPSPPLRQLPKTQTLPTPYNIHHPSSLIKPPSAPTKTPSPSPPESPPTESHFPSPGSHHSSPSYRLHARPVQTGRPPPSATNRAARAPNRFRRYRRRGPRPTCRSASAGSCCARSVGSRASARAWSGLLCVCLWRAGWRRCWSG